MSWLSNFVRPKIRALVKKSDTPNNLWVKCNGCEQMVYHKDLKETLSVCPTCSYHMKMSARQRLNWILDEETILEINTPQTILDPLKFKDNKRYTDRLKVSKEKTQNKDAIIIASGQIGGNNAVVAALDFNFMGGSMGVAVGEGFLAAAKEAVNLNTPLVVFTSSGGARMQEGIFSLMQLPRTVIAVNKLKENNIPYIVVLTDPTTGGVSASFAMLGDVTYAEPGALIGFAGPRVIQSTVHETLPEGFQTSEYLLEHGMIDDVISRKNLKSVIANTIMHLVNNVSTQRSSSH
ncbi:MAG: acetyl-CoA carboxylase, carboxyltransferase subunit beta [Alphaproteobacteria bacterium]|jgi:acetyl-CoA carboxylase carboxyl transferase subunit beta|tara:strand:- start:416 stop:1291 length:876 start_codon:yes stop_codon:yes gene_type:complete